MFTAIPGMATVTSDQQIFCKKYRLEGTNSFLFSVCKLWTRREARSLFQPWATPSHCQKEHRSPTVSSNRSLVSRRPWSCLLSKRWQL